MSDQGNFFGSFIAEVRDLMDPWESGRLKLRIYGHHDNEQDIKDEDLPWGMPLQTITSAATNRVGTSPTGALVGSRVYGIFLDEAQQYPIILGTFARAGKLQDDNDNTGGYDDIDDKYSDVPIAARGTKQINETRGQKKNKIKSKKQSSSESSGDGYDQTQDYKYNNLPYMAENDGMDGINDAKQAFSKMFDKPTVGSIDKTDFSDILSKILNVDSKNDAGALPMAPQAMQQMMQLVNMNSVGGLTSMLGGGMGMSLGGLAGGLGINNIMGSLSNMLGVDLSMISGMAGMIGGMGAGGSGQSSGQGGGIGGGPGPYYAPQVPTTANAVAITAVTLLNQLGGYSTPSNTIAGLSVQDKEALYTAVLNLMNSVDTSLNVNTSITIHSNNYVSFTTSNTVVTPSNGTIILPGYYTSSVGLIPDHYIPVYYFTTTDPYPGYMEWESLGATADVDANSAFILQDGSKTYLAAGERVFCPRPPSIPYVQNPEEDNLNAAILAIITELLLLVQQGKLTITEYLNLTNNASNAAQNNANQNTFGKNTSNNNNMMQSILGALGGLLGNMQSLQLPQSVLDNGDISQIFQDFQKKNVVAVMLKGLGDQAISQQNPLQGMLDNNLLNFGNIPSFGSAGGGSGGGNQGQTQGSPLGGSNAPSISSTITYVTTSGNNTTYSTKPNPYSSNNAVTFGYYTIYGANNG